MIRRICVFVSALLICLPAIGNTVETMETKDSKLKTFVGPGVIVNSKPYQGIGADFSPVPFYFCESKRFYVRGTSCGYKLGESGPFSYEVIGEIRFEGYDADDSRQLKGMSDRDKTFDAGAAVSYATGLGKANLAFLTDTFGKHKGQEVTLSLSKALRKDKFLLTPVAGFAWRTAHMNDYYYGVRTGEVTSQRGSYQAGSDTNFFAGFNAQYTLKDKWSLYTSFKWTCLGSEITKSPIVDQHYSTSFVVGLLYSF